MYPVNGKLESQVAFSLHNVATERQVQNLGAGLAVEHWVHPDHGNNRNFRRHIPKRRYCPDFTVRPSRSSLSLTRENPERSRQPPICLCPREHGAFTVRWRTRRSRLITTSPILARLAGIDRLNHNLVSGPIRACASNCASCAGRELRRCILSRVGYCY